jgi:hypothetical protein
VLYRLHLAGTVVFSIMNLLTLAGFHRNKEQQRFYLLPGMGGRAFRKKQKVILQWSIAAGLLASGAVAVILWMMSKR